jgi:regulatory protein
VSERALELACRYLNRRERTVAEVRRHLVAHDVDARSADEAIRELTEQGYLDDHRFARLFAEDKRHLEQWGAGRIRRALLACGIAPELAETVLGEDDGPSERGGGELERAMALLRRRFPNPPRDRRERERSLGMLLRKGYELELAREALTAYAQCDA